MADSVTPSSKLPPKQTGLPRRLVGSGRSTPMRASHESLVSNPPDDPGNPPIDDWIVGDVCYVNGAKCGRVAFLGETRFAPGEWAGVALEEPQGKNDGQVAGHRYFQCTANHGIFCRVSKLTRTAGDTTLTDLVPNAQSTPNSRDPFLVQRASTERELSPLDVSVISSAPLNDVTLNPNKYFACKPRFGLFAPASKVVRAVSQSTSKKILPVRHTKTSQMRLHRSGSQESLSSLSSFTSFASTSTAARIKRSQAPHKANYGGNTTAVGALQESIQEKEMHVEQLLKERDMERAEMARASQQCEMQRLAEYKRQAENEYSELMARVKHIETALKESETEKEALASNLDEWKRKAEDFQFQLEEASILKSDLESQIADMSCVDGKMELKTSENDSPLVLDLQKMNETLKTRVCSLDKHVQESRACEADLRHKLLQIESFRENETKSYETKMTALQVEFEKLKTDLVRRDEEVETLNLAIGEHKKLEEDSKHLCLKLDSNVKELMAQNSEEEHKLSEIKKRCNELEKERNNLESQLAQKSGATSETLELINQKNEEVENILRNQAGTVEQLKKAESEIGSLKEINLGLESQLQTISQENIGKNKVLEAEVSKLQEGLEKSQKSLMESQESEKALLESHKIEIENLKQILSKTQAELEKKSAEVDSLKLLESSWNDAKSKLDLEIEGLRQAQHMAADALAKQLVDEKNRLECECMKFKENLAIKEAAFVELSTKQSGLETEIKEKISLCEKLEVEKVDVLQKLEESNKVVGNLKNELEKAENASKMRVSGFNEERKELNAEINKLKGEGTGLQTKNSELETRLHDLTENSKKIERDFEDSLKKVAVFETKLKISEEDKLRLESDMKNLAETQVLNADVAVKQITEEKNRLCEELKTVHENAGSLELELTSLKHEKEFLSKKNEEIEEKLKILENERCDSLKTLEEDNCKITAISKENSELKLNCESLSQEKTNCLEKLRVVESELISTQEELKSVNNDKVGLISSHDAVVTEYKNNKDMLTSQLAESSNELKSCKVEFETRVSNISKERDASVADVSRLSQQLQESINTTKSYELQVADFSEKIAVFETNLKISDEEKVRLETELKALKESQVLDADAAAKQITEEKNRLCQELKTVHENVGSLELQLTSLRHEKECVVKKNEETEDRLKILENEKSEISQHLEQSKIDFESSQKEKEDWKSKYESLNRETLSISEKFKIIESELENAQQMLKNFESSKIEEVAKQEIVLKEFDVTKKKLTSELNDSIKDLANSKAEFESQIEAVRKERDEIKQELARISDQAASSVNKEKVNELNKHINELKQNWETAKDFEQQLKLSECTVSEMKQLDVLKEAENRKLKVELEKLQIVVNKLKEVDCENAKLQQDLLDARKSKSALTSEFDIERCKYQLQLQEATERLKDTESRLENTNHQAASTNEIDSIPLSKLEDEKQELLTRISRLESKLASAQEIKTDKPLAASGSREVELESQVTFLNSIIVDQRRKQEEMQQKIEVLMTTPIDAMANVKKVPAPRVYCDICEQFDVHETEDCPTQASEVQELANHSAHHARDKPERPYCHNCEEFGHESADCDSEMF